MGGVELGNAKNGVTQKRQRTDIGEKTQKLEESQRFEQKGE